MFLNEISMYYCFLCPSPSLVIIACHSLPVHQFASTLPSVCHLLWVKVTGIILVWGGTTNCSAVWAHGSRQTNYFCRDDAGGLCPFLFHGVYLLVQALNLFLLYRHCVY